MTALDIRSIWLIFNYVLSFSFYSHKDRNFHFTFIWLSEDDFRNVMNHLSHHFNLFEAMHFVLTGESAGGFGVRKQINSNILKFKLNPSKITFPSNNQTSQFKTIKTTRLVSIVTMLQTGFTPTTQTCRF